MQKNESVVEYSLKAVVDWLFKRSPVTYFIGLILGVAGMAMSGDFSLDASSNSLRFSYGNNLSSYSLALVIICCLLSFGAVHLQMKERYAKLMKEKELELLAEKENLRHESRKEIEKLRVQLALEKNKLKATHDNLGTASNALLKKIVKLEGIFAGYIGSGTIDPVYVDGKKIDVYIANAITEQHKFRKLYINDKSLLDSWNEMLSYLDQSQRAITRAINGEPLDSLPLSKAAMYISDYMSQISSSGHKIEVET